MLLKTTLPSGAWAPPAEARAPCFQKHILSPLRNLPSILCPTRSCRASIKWALFMDESRFFRLPSMISASSMDGSWFFCLLSMIWTSSMDGNGDSITPRRDVNEKPSAFLSRRAKCPKRSNEFRDVNEKPSPFLSRKKLTLTDSDAPHVSGRRPKDLPTKKPSPAQR